MTGSGYSMLFGGPRPNGRGGRLFVVGLVLGLGGGFFAGSMWGASVTTTRPADKAPRPAGEQQPERPPTEPAATPAPEVAQPPPADDLRLLKSTISGSLVGTLSGQIESREAEVLSAHIGRLLIWWLDLRRDLLGGDRLEVLYRPSPDPEKVRVLALRYHSEKLGQQLEAFFYQPAGVRYGRYFDGQGKEIELRLQAAPIEDYEQVTERMNLSGRRHRGVDFKAEVGTPVLAPHRARVLRRNWQSRLNGNCLQLEYLDNGWFALFLHLDAVEPEAKPGRVVEAGQIVARSGNTGRSTAPHLHYELHSTGGRLLDPFRVEPTMRRQLEGETLASFFKARDQMLRRLGGSSPAGEATPPPAGSSAETAPAE